MSFQTPAITSPGKTMPLLLEKPNPRPSSTEPSSSDCPVGVSKKTAKMPDVSPTALICAVTLTCEPTQQPAVGPWNSSKTVVFSLAGRAGFVELSASNCNPIAMHDGMVTVLVLVVLLVLLLVLLVLLVVVLVLVVLALALVEGGPYGWYRRSRRRQRRERGSCATAPRLWWESRYSVKSRTSLRNWKRTCFSSKHSTSLKSQPDVNTSITDKDKKCIIITALWQVFGKHSENGSITVGLKVWTKTALCDSHWFACHGWTPSKDVQGHFKNQSNKKWAVHVLDKIVDLQCFIYSCELSSLSTLLSLMSSPDRIAGVPDSHRLPSKIANQLSSSHLVHQY